MLFSEKCADPDKNSYYACGNSSRPSLFAKVPLLEEITKGKHNYCCFLNCKSGRKSCADPESFVRGGPHLITFFVFFFVLFFYS